MIRIHFIAANDEGEGAEIAMNSFTAQVQYSQEDFTESNCYMRKFRFRRPEIVKVRATTVRKLSKKLGDQSSLTRGGKSENQFKPRRGKNIEFHCCAQFRRGGMSVASSDSGCILARNCLTALMSIRAPPPPPPGRELLFALIILSISINSSSLSSSSSSPSTSVKFLSLVPGPHNL